MAFGLETINDYGAVQISESTSNLRVVQRGFAASGEVVDTANHGNYPAVFVKPPGSVGNGIWAAVAESFNWSPESRFCFMAPSSYEYAVCSHRGGLMHPGGWGAQVFREDSSVAWDSQYIQPYISIVRRIPPNSLDFHYNNPYKISLPDSSQEWLVSMPRCNYGFSIDAHSPSDIYTTYWQLSCWYSAPNELSFALVTDNRPYWPLWTGLAEYYGGPNDNTVIMIAKIK